MEAALSIVVRIQKVVTPRAQLEAALGMPVDRYETIKDGTFYSQIDVRDSADPWQEAVPLVESIAAPLRRLTEAELVGFVSLDVAFALKDTRYTITSTVPRAVLAALVGADLGLDVSLYRSSS